MINRIAVSHENPAIRHPSHSTPAFGIVIPSQKNHLDFLLLDQREEPLEEFPGSFFSRPRDTLLPNIARQNQAINILQKRPQHRRAAQAGRRMSEMEIGENAGSHSILWRTAS